MKKALLAVVVAVVLGGCATPPGQLEDSDLVWTDITLNSDISTVINNLKMGFRQCGRDFGQPEYIENKNSAYVDVYVSNLFGGKSPWTLGKIEVSQHNDQTHVRSGIQNRYSKKTGDVWNKWVQGNLTCQ